MSVELRERERVALLERIRRKALCLTIAVEPAEKVRLHRDLEQALGEYHERFERAGQRT